MTACSFFPLANKRSLKYIVQNLYTTDCIYIFLKTSLLSKEKPFLHLKARVSTIPDRGGTKWILYDK